jgi:hypothetical protein
MAFTSAALALGLLLTGSRQETTGYLTARIKGPDGKVHKETRPYHPREGDLIFYDDHSVVWTVLFAWAGSGPPLHMGIVIRRPDGSLGVLEAGPNDTVKVYIIDVGKRLKEFDGTISIRRCKTALTREKSAALTKFAMAQEGKPYAVLRLLLQGTSFRSRGPVRELFLANTYLDRWSWICSELAVAAGSVAGLIDPRAVPSNVVYPLDVVDDHRYDLSRHFHGAELWRAVGFARR